MTVPYQGIVFNAEWAALKTQVEFIEHEKHHGLTDTQLKEAHKLCKEAAKASVQPPEPSVDGGK